MENQRNSKFEVILGGGHHRKIKILGFFWGETIKKSEIRLCLRNSQSSEFEVTFEEKSRKLQNLRLCLGEKSY